MPLKRAANSQTANRVTIFQIINPEINVPTLIMFRKFIPETLVCRPYIMNPGRTFGINVTPKKQTA